MINVIYNKSFCTNHYEKGELRNLSDDFFFKLEYKHFKPLFGRGYYTINKTTLFAMGILQPIFILICIGLIVWSSYDKDIINIVMGSIMGFFGILFLPYRMYPKLSNYFKIMKIESLVEKDDFNSILNLIKLEDDISFLAVKYLSKISCKELDEKLIDYIDESKNDQLVNLIVDYLCISNPNNSMKILEKIKQTKEKKKRRKYFTILQNYRTISDYVKSEEIITILIKEETPDLFPMIFRILNYYEENFDQLIPIINNFYDRFPVSTIPIEAIEILSRNSSENADLVIRKAIENVDDVFIKSRIAEILRERKIELAFKTQQVSLTEETFLDAKISKKSISEKIHSEESKEMFISKMDELIDFFKSEAIRVENKASIMHNFNIYLDHMKKIYDLELSFKNDLDIFIKYGEGKNIELKQSIAEKKTHERFAVSAASFANSKGGLIFIGVTQGKEVKGIKDDLSKYKSDDPKDEYRLEIIRIFSDRFKIKNLDFVSVYFIPYEKHELCVVKVNISGKAIFVNKNEFWVRITSGNKKLPPKEMVDYCKQKWPYSN